MTDMAEIWKLLGDWLNPNEYPRGQRDGYAAGRAGRKPSYVRMGLSMPLVFHPGSNVPLETYADGYKAGYWQGHAERLHEQVRKEYWGYAKDENLSIEDMLVEKFQGIRPAVGYPSLPDTSLNFLLDEILDMKQIGIRLTESGAMKPHASVSGMMISNPKARYFAIGKIGEDQLQDYARRRAVPAEVLRKWLNL